MKVDLAELDREVRDLKTCEDIRALIRVARAAREFIDCGTWPRKSELRVELVAALSDIEDSK
jgi:hypothetical protein